MLSKSDTKLLEDMSHTPVGLVCAHRWMRPMDDILVRQPVHHLSPQGQAEGYNECRHMENHPLARRYC